MQPKLTPSLDEISTAYIRAGSVYINAKIAKGFFSKFRGLLFKPALDDREALVITPCRSVHTCGMHYAIDLIFLNKQFKVINIEHQCQPWRFFYCKGAVHTIEMMGGQAEMLNLSIGQTFIFYPTSLE
ncbi:MAG: hypothetical protein B7X95_05985 [Methylophilaceae bacterium 17-44-8]|jgi:hypothetical protein|nr:MAG: hypothetical protein B7Y48_08490 [Methylophilales bacterium 28-44-11]OZA05552.1 MAG: hypothetical protein B7X95_05985 [Methylophilaceae bacterium 17-44-8]